MSSESSHESRFTEFPFTEVRQVTADATGSHAGSDSPGRRPGPSVTPAVTVAATARADGDSDRELSSSLPVTLLRRLQLERESDSEASENLETVPGPYPAASPRPRRPAVRTGGSGDS